MIILIFIEPNILFFQFGYLPIKFQIYIYIYYKVEIRIYCFHFLRNGTRVFERRGKVMV